MTKQITLELMRVLFIGTNNNFLLEKLVALGYTEDQLENVESFFLSLPDVPATPYDGVSVISMHRLIEEQNKILTSVLELLVKLNSPQFTFNASIIDKEVTESIGDVSRTVKHYVSKEQKERNRLADEALEADDDAEDNQDGSPDEDDPEDTGEPMLTEAERQEKWIKEHEIPVTDPSHPEYVPPDVAGPKPRRKAGKQEMLAKDIGKVICNFGIDYVRKHSTFGPNVYRTKFFCVHFKDKVYSRRQVLEKCKTVCETLRKIKGVERVEFKVVKIYFETVSIYVYYKKDYVK